MIRWPSLLGGKHKLVSWLNRLVIGCRASEVTQVIGSGRLIESTSGKTIEIWNQKTIDSNPFRIYQTTDYLHYKVSDGYVVGTGDPITVTGVDTELVLTSGVATYWIYLEMTATTAEIKKSATTLTWSSTLIPIGWVDTQTVGAGIIYQMLKDHVFNPCAT